MALSAGVHLGPYEIVGLIGAGGMGEVYRAHDPRLGRDVAIKVLPAHLSANPETRARFEREARASSQLSHPGSRQPSKRKSSGSSIAARIPRGPA